MTTPVAAIFISSNPVSAKRTKVQSASKTKRVAVSSRDGFPILAARFRSAPEKPRAPPHVYRVGNLGERFQIDRDRDRLS
jgi:hypothetical protein